jgi:hypothetical protein
MLKSKKPTIKVATIINKMKFTCINLRKTGTLEHRDEKLVFMGSEISNKQVYLFPSSLTEEHVQLFVLVDGLHHKKEVLHFKSQSWLVGASDDTEDQAAVDALNFEVEQLVKDFITCAKDIILPARVHKTTTMSEVVFRKDEVLSAGALYYRKTNDIEVIFCERVTSYTKTFDLTFVLKSCKVETHSCMERKRLKEVEAWAGKNSIEFYQTGPDPLPWKQMLSYHTEQSWKEINDLLNHVSSEEDDGSDWEAGDTDPEEEDLEDYVDSEEEEEDYPSGASDSDEEYAIEVKSNKRVLSDSESEDEPPSKKTKC